MADLDPVQLGFTFAKEVATQLITLSTGILALSITYHKDIVKGAPLTSEGLLRSAWGAHLVSILGGVWTLMALTGTLMPVDPKTRTTPLLFDGNVRIPASLQVVAFFIGVLLLVVVYGRRTEKAVEQNEYQIVTARPDEIGLQLTALSSEGWEIASTAARETGDIGVLLKRPIKKPPA
jgi:hypothetical protein